MLPDRLYQTSPFIKLKKPFKINDLVTAFYNTPDSYALQKKDQEMCSGISTHDYLTVTFQWSCIVNRHLHDPTLMV